MSLSYRFSGHESFPCRYAWLPKAVGLIRKDTRLLADDKKAMVELGIGKNMVRATRFWVQVAGMATATKGVYKTTELGDLILGEDGYDPYLEDLQTLWLIHWQLCSQAEEQLFAWDFLLNRWSHPELSKAAVLEAFRQESNRLQHDRPLSDITLEQHFDTFLHSYVPTRNPDDELQEDNLDCPLVELRLLEAVGEKRLESGRRETVYAFRREPKSEICPGLFLYCIEDFWRKHRPKERTLTFRDISVASGSPGQIFKMPEVEVRERLEQAASDSGGALVYKESTTIQQLERSIELGSKELSSKALLKMIFRKARN